MDGSEFKKIKDSLKIRTLYRLATRDNGRVEVATGDGGIVHYAVELDLHGNFMKTCPEHPFAKTVAQQCKINYGD